MCAAIMAIKDATFDARSLPYNPQSLLQPPMTSYLEFLKQPSKVAAAAMMIDDDDEPLKTAIA